LLSDIPDNELHEVVIGRSVVVLVRRGNEVLAFQGLCPHQSARLAEGTLVGNELQCARHLARFRLSDGSCGAGWQLPALKRYAVRIDDDEILLADPLTPID
jgi:3-phenylpropionate/trans-cinnamate dioxygenase ferredoxin subunit